MEVTELGETPSAEVIPVLRLILGGRTKDAMKVRERFRETAENVANCHEHPSGYFVVVWDDEGYSASAFYLGDRFPVPPNEIPKIVDENLKARMFS